MYLLRGPPRGGRARGGHRPASPPALAPGAWRYIYIYIYIYTYLHIYIYIIERVRDG